MDFSDLAQLFVNRMEELDAKVEMQRKRLEEQDAKVEEHRARIDEQDTKLGYLFELTADMAFVLLTKLFEVKLRETNVIHNGENFGAASNRWKDRFGDKIKLVFPELDMNGTEVRQASLLLLQARNSSVHSKSIDLSPESKIVLYNEFVTKNFVAKIQGELSEKEKENILKLVKVICYSTPVPQEPKRRYNEAMIPLSVKPKKVKMNKRS